MKLIGTDLCIKCIEAKERLEEEGITFEYTDFTQDIHELKKFFLFRDSHDEFLASKKEGRIGIPCFLFEDGTLTPDLEQAIEKAKSL